MLATTKNVRKCKTARRFMNGLKQTRKLSRLQKPCQTLYPIGMKALCAFAFCLVFAAAEGVAKQRHCTFRLHAQANAKDTEVFATSVHAQLSGKEVAIEKVPRVSENDVIAFYPYTAANGTYGALFQLDDHGRVALDTLSIERRGSLLFVFINGRPITELEIDKRVSDGKIYIPSGLTSEDIELMKKDWRMIGQRKRQKP